MSTVFYSVYSTIIMFFQCKKEKQMKIRNTVKVSDKLPLHHFGAFKTRDMQILTPGPCLFHFVTWKHFRILKQVDMLHGP